MIPFFSHLGLLSLPLSLMVWNGLLFIHRFLSRFLFLSPSSPAPPFLPPFGLGYYSLLVSSCRHCTCFTLLLFSNPLCIFPFMEWKHDQCDIRLLWQMYFPNHERIFSLQYNPFRDIIDIDMKLVGAPNCSFIRGSTFDRLYGSR